MSNEPSPIYAALLWRIEYDTDRIANMRAEGRDDEATVLSRTVDRNVQLLADLDRDPFGLKKPGAPRPAKKVRKAKKKPTKDALPAPVRAATATEMRERLYGLYKNQGDPAAIRKLEARLTKLGVYFARIKTP